MQNIVVKDSKFGKGVFSSKDLGKGEHICFLKGKVMGLEVLQSLKRRKREILVDPLQIGSEEYIDLEEPYMFVNHSCDPNAGIKGKNELFAIQDIKEGEEIFFDYSTTIDEGMNCECDVENCRKKIGDFLTLPKEIQQKYIELGALPDFIKEKLS